MKVLFIAIGIIIIIAAIIALRVFFGLGHPGNAAPYALRRQLPRDNSPLRGKTILCLGKRLCVVNGFMYYYELFFRCSLFWML